MSVSRRIAPVLAVSVLLVLSMVGSAAAAGPATVTVRVEGLNGTTLLPQTAVSTTATPVAGGCSGTSAGGALYDAVHGNWTVKDDGGELGYEIDGIDGLNFPAFGENGDAYWSFWLNDTFASNGACGEELTSGADVVFFAACDGLGADCPTSATAPDHFLTATAPTSTNIGVGGSVSTTIGSINTGTGTAEGALPSGVLVTAGSVSAVPDAHGVATLTFASAGTYTLQAHAADAVPSDPYVVCVHNGSDGTCGTTTPGGSSTVSPSPGASPVSPPYSGPYAVVAKVSGLHEGQVYRRGHAPRVLSGSVAGHNPISAVNLELRRSYNGRCSSYDATRGRFVVARCGQGLSFNVSSTGSFSYLLPASLAPGRYVLDIYASDALGNRTTLARGTTRTVFRVG